MPFQQGIWLPLDSTQPNSSILYSPSSPLHNMDDVGIPLLCSSSHLATISRLRSLFCGLPVFYRLRDPRIMIKDNRFLLTHLQKVNHLNAYSDSKLNRFVNSALVDLAQERVEEVLCGPLSKTPLEDIIKACPDLGLRLSSPSDAWQDFLKPTSSIYSEPYEDVTSEIAAAHLTQWCLALVHRQPIKLSIQPSYFWKEGQFWGLAQSHTASGPQMITAPLIQLAAIHPQKEPYGSIPHYLRSMTPADRASLRHLFSALADQLPLDLLFSKTKHISLHSLYEELILEEQIRLPSTLAQRTRSL